MRAEEHKKHDQQITNCGSWKALLKEEEKFSGSNKSWQCRCWELHDRKSSDILSKITLVVTLRDRKSVV